MDPKHISRGITEGRDRAPSRAMFKAIGFTDADLSRPLIGVANTWIETMPCNFHLRRLAAKVKEGIREAGGTPMEFNTVAISDGETMGVEGMRASLVSRELIADSIELVCRGQMFDAVVCVVGCDKTIPAAAMALARTNLPGVVLYGGHAYSVGIGATPIRGLTASVAYSQALTNTTDSSVNSNNNTSQLTATVVYRVRKTYFQAGYERLVQGFSASGVPQSMLGSFYFGITRWFSFF